MREIDGVVERVSARHEDKLVAYAPAALPVFSLRVEVLLSGRREIGAAELAMMQAINAGLELVDDVVGFLGVTDQYFRHLLASLEQQGMVVEVGDPPKLVLRERGRAALGDGITEEKIEELRIQYDPIVGRIAVIRPVPVHRADLGQVHLFGERLAVEPLESDVDPLAVEQAMRDAGLARELAGLRILRVTSLLEIKIRFRPVTAIIFRNPVSSRLGISFAENGQILDAIHGKLSEQNDPAIREAFALCNSEEEKGKFQALVDQMLSSDLNDRRSLKSKEIIKAKVRRSRLQKEVEADPSEERCLALEGLNTTIEADCKTLEHMDGFVKSGLATERSIVEILQNAESHILLAVPGEPSEFPREYLQLLIAATTRRVTVTVVYSSEEGRPGNGSKNLANVLSKDAKEIHWKKMTARVPVFAVAWDGKGMLLVSHPPFAIDGRPERLVPRFSAMLSEKNALQLFFGRVSQELLAWAMTKRETKNGRRRSRSGPLLNERHGDRKGSNQAGTSKNDSVQTIKGAGHHREKNRTR